MKPGLRMLAVVALMITSAVGLGAQTTSPIHKNAWIVGGSAALSHNANETADVSTTALSIAPTALTFLTEHFAFGGSATLGWSTSDIGNTYTVGLGPSARYYFSGPQDALLPFVSASMLPSHEHFGEEQTFPDGSSHDLNVNFLMYDASVGATQVIASRVGLTGELFYTRQHARQSFSGTSSDVTVKNTAYGLRFGFTIFVH